MNCQGCLPPLIATYGDHSDGKSIKPFDAHSPGNLHLYARHLRLYTTERAKKNVDSQIVRDIVRDLSLSDRGTEVLQVANDGEREVAIVLTKSNEQYKLLGVHRSPGEHNQNSGSWKLWLNYESAEDGTGAEQPAVREYSQMPDSETIDAFRSDMLAHWSNRTGSRP